MIRRAVAAIARAAGLVDPFAPAFPDRSREVVAAEHIPAGAVVAKDPETGLAHRLRGMKFAVESTRGTAEGPRLPAMILIDERAYLDAHHKGLSRHFGIDEGAPGGDETALFVRDGDQVIQSETWRPRP